MTDRRSGLTARGSLGLCTVVASISAAGCIPFRQAESPPPADLTFIVLVDQGGGVGSILPLGADLQGLWHPDTQSVLALQLEVSELSDLRPPLDPSRLEDALVHEDVSIEAGCELRGVVTERDTIYLRLLDRARALELDGSTWTSARPERTSQLSHLVVELPTADPSCEGETSLEAYGDDNPLVAPSAPEHERCLVQAVPLDESRALLLAAGGLHLAERGRALEPSNSRFFVDVLPDAGEARWQGRSLALTETPSGHRGLLVAAKVSANLSTHFSGALFQIEVEGTQIVVTSSAAFEMPASPPQRNAILDRIALLGDHFLAVGRAGYLTGQLGRPLGSVQWHPTDPDTRPHDVVFVAPDRHVIAASAATLLVGDARLGPGALDRVTSGAFRGEDFIALSSIDDQIFIGTDSGALLRYDDALETLETIEIFLPRDAGACQGATQSCGRFVPSEDLREVAKISDDRIAFTLDHCGAVFAVDMARGCVGAWPLSPEGRIVLREAVSRGVTRGGISVSSEGEAFVLSD